MVCFLNGDSVFFDFEVFKGWISKRKEGTIDDLCGLSSLLSVQPGLNILLLLCCCPVHSYRADTIPWASYSPRALFLALLK